MAKRMAVTLAATVMIVAALGFVKFKQVQTAIGQAAAFQPPPEAVTTIVAAEEEWPATLTAIGTVAAVQGVTVSADLPGTVERIGFESGTCGPRGRRAGAARHAAGARAARGGRGAARARAREPRAHAGAARRARRLAGRIRPRDRRRHVRATRASARSARRSSARRFARRFPACSGIRQRQPRPVSVGRRPAGHARSRSIRSTSTSACRSRRWRACGRGAPCRVTAADAAGASSPAGSPPIDSVVDAVDAQHPGAGDASPTRDGTLRPGMFVQAEVTLGAPSRGRLAAGVGDQLRAVRRLGVRRRRPEGSERTSRIAACASSSSKSGRRAAIRSRVLSGLKAGEEVVTSGVFKLRNGAAVARQQQGAAGEQPDAEAGEQLMKFTDLFVKRPVLAIVVNLVILIAGLQSIRALSVRQYPRSDIAVVTVTTAYVGANADLVRGFITTPLERVIASADGIDYMESSSAQGVSTITVHLKLNYDTNAALTQIQAKVAQVRNDLPPEAEAPIIDLADRRQPVRGDLSRLLVERSRSEPDHRLPDARRPAEAERHQRRPARRHPRRAHVRDAHLAEAGSHGGARHRAVDGPRRARAQQLPVGARPDQGLDGVGQPRREHRPADAPTSSGSWSSRSRTASSCGSATSPTSCSAPRTTSRTSASTASRRRSWASGCCRRANTLDVIAKVRDDDAGDPGAAAGRHEGRHPVRLDRVHQGRDQRGAAHADRDAAHRHRRDLPVPRLVPLGADSDRRDSGVAGRRGVPDARSPASPSTC